MSENSFAKRVAGTVLGMIKGAPDSGFAAASSLARAREVISRIRTIMGEKARILGLEDAELQKVESLRTRLEEVETARLDALAEHRVSGGEAPGETAGKLLAQATAIRQEMNDAQAVALRLNERAKKLDIELEPMKRVYRNEMGVFLSDMYERLAKHYDEHAREAGEAVVQIAALHRVMMRYMTGNTNGWNGALHLPGIVPGQGNSIDPLYEAGSQKFHQAANARMEDIFAQLRAAGFTWRFD